MSRIDLRYFSQAEFRDSWDVMSVRQLILMDSARHQWGKKITVSPVLGALARFNGPDDQSQHNVDMWGECRACDVFFEGMINTRAANQVIRILACTGFTGAGLYPDWNPQPGIHADCRQSVEPGEPAFWGMIDDGDGQYEVSLEKALERMP